MVRLLRRLVEMNDTKRVNKSCYALVAWPKEAGSMYILLPGRYETLSGASLGADIAAMKYNRTMQIVEVADNSL